MKEKKFKNLRIFNLVMAFLHAVQGALMLYLSNDFSLPITTSFLKFNPMIQKLFPVTETIWEVRIGPMVAGFLFLSAAAHLLISLPGIYDWYITNLKKGINKARWMEYSVSSSLMIVIIAMLVGMYDGVSLLLMFSLNACMILFGWVMEVHNQYTKKTNWTSYIFGCFAGLIPWVAVALYLVGSIEGEQGPPNFVYGVFFSIFIFFNIFAINMILQYKKVGPWKDYVFGEKVYIILSLVAKSVLAWQVFAGTLRPV
ncbi:heliorhodopsin HeR [Patescibacteria group bacterium]|nr:heliorhodopsin HeR [Patescibacteria group bacterium]